MTTDGGARIQSVWVAYSIRCSCRWKVVESGVGRGSGKPAYCGMDESSSHFDKDCTTIALGSGHCRLISHVRPGGAHDLYARRVQSAAL
jgi:hypothetical protein